MFETGRDLKVTGWIEAFRQSKGKVTLEAIERVAEKIVQDHSTGARSTAKGRLRPSMLGEDCLRKHALAYLDAPKGSRPQQWEQMADAGSWLHYKWQAELLSGFYHEGYPVEPLLVDIEVSLSDASIGVKGQCDGILQDGSLLEIKTLGADKYLGKKYGTNPVDSWFSPPHEHLCQVDAYMMCSGAPAAHLLYVNRDSNQYREFYVPASKERQDRIRRDTILPSLLAISKAVETSELPPRHEDCTVLGKGKTRWCDYAEYCFAVSDASGLFDKTEARR